MLTLVVAFNAAALGMLVAALAKTAKQADSIGVIMAFVLAGLGGALAMSPTPLFRSGGFIGMISSLTPQNHAVEGYYQLMAENAILYPGFTADGHPIGYGHRILPDCAMEVQV